MSIVTIRSAAGAAERDSIFVRLRGLAAALFGNGAGARREGDDAALLGMSARELRDIGLVRIGDAGDARFVSDRDLA